MQLIIYLVDDGSSDGTAAAVNELHPEVVLLRGNGSLYWGGGTRLACERAILENPDFILWLNDDVELEGLAVETLLSTSRLFESKAIVAGSLSEARTGSHLYGGYRQSNPKRPLRFEPVTPSDQPQKVATMNGNVVLVPRPIWRLLGPPDKRFGHNMADMDYGLRSRSHGFDVVVAPGYVGTCQSNPGKQAWRDASTPLLDRWRFVISPKGLPPTEWLCFTFRYGGIRWPLYFLSPYLRAAFPTLMSRRKSRRPAE